MKADVERKLKKLEFTEVSTDLWQKHFLWVMFTVVLADDRMQVVWRGNGGRGVAYDFPGAPDAEDFCECYGAMLKWARGVLASQEDSLDEEQGKLIGFV